MRPQFFLNKTEPVPTPSSSPTPSAASPRKRKNWFGKFLLTLLILALAGGLGYVGKLYWDAQQQLKSVKSDIASKVTNLTDQEMNMLIKDVAKHITLPGDRPQIVTITNVDELRINQPFFNSAQNGDKLLVYTSKVVLYRPSIDKVIDLAQIRTASGSAAASASAALNAKSATVSATQVP